MRVAEGTTKGVVYGVIGTALAQATLAAIGLWIAGIPAWLFLGFITFFVSIVPPGAPLIWLPATAWLVYNDQIGWAIFMGVWGFFVVSGIDNFLKPYFISRGSAMPLLLVLLGVFGGALAFGFLGVFLGPIFIAVGYTLVREWSAFEAPPGDSVVLPGPPDCAERKRLTPTAAPVRACNREAPAGLRRPPRRKRRARRSASPVGSDREASLRPRAKPRLPRSWPPTWTATPQPRPRQVVAAAFPRASGSPALRAHGQGRYSWSGPSPPDRPVQFSAAAST